MPRQPPTIGRIVHYLQAHKDEPNAAIVTSVLPNGNVGITVFGKQGATWHIDNVAWSQEYQEGHWSWPVMK